MRRFLVTLGFNFALMILLFYQIGTRHYGSFDEMDSAVDSYSSLNEKLENDYKEKTKVSKDEFGVVSIQFSGKYEELNGLLNYIQNQTDFRLNKINVNNLTIFSSNPDLNALVKMR